MRCRWIMRLINSSPNSTPIGPLRINKNIGLHTRKIFDESLHLVLKMPRGPGASMRSMPPSPCSAVIVQAVVKARVAVMLADDDDACSTVEGRLTGYLAYLANLPDACTNSGDSAHKKQIASVCPPEQQPAAARIDVDVRW